MMITMKFEAEQLLFIFAVYENISLDMLVGCDNLYRYKTVVGMETSDVIFIDNGKVINVKIMSKDKELLDRTKQSVNDVKLIENNDNSNENDLISDKLSVSKICNEADQKGEKEKQEQMEAKPKTWEKNRHEILNIQQILNRTKEILNINGAQKS